MEASDERKPGRERRAAVVPVTPSPPVTPPGPPAVVLDAGPLGLLAPARTTEVQAINAWLRLLVSAGREVFVPEIADCEVRRELVRAGRTASVARLDVLKFSLRYVPITTRAMLLAADLWAQVRQQGTPTADPHALDGDVILAAQSLTLDPLPSGLVVATTNAAHLSRFVPATRWQDIAAA